MADLAVGNYDGPSPTALKEKRRRLGRAYSDGAYSEEEYNQRLAEIDRQLQQASNVTTPAAEEAIELFSNIPMLWNEATTDERRQLISTLVEMVYVDLKTKHVAGLRPTPAFRALFGAGIDASPDAPVKLVPQCEATKDIVGVGGDGGDSVSQYPDFGFSGIAAKRGIYVDFGSISAICLPSLVICTKTSRKKDSRCSSVTI